MARPKKEDNMNIESTVEVYEMNEVEKLKKEKEESDRKFLELQTQMDMILKQMALQNANGNTNNQDEDVAVGCMSINGASIANNDESIIYNLKYKEVIDISFSELKDCFKSKINPYRELFKKGIFYFEDEKYYEIFKIKDVVDMSDEALVDMLIKGEVPYKEKLYIRGHKDNTFFLTLVYRVADLYRQGNLVKWTYQDRMSFENYFKIKIDNCVNQLNLLGY